MYYKNIYYEKINNGDKNIIFLHGWQGSYKSFFHLKDMIDKNINLYFLDLPGFGKSVLDIAYNLNDYSNIIFEFINDLNIKDPLIVGHSFGGRIALKMLENKGFKTILISTPSIYKKSLKTKIKLLINRIFKISFASKDYKEANPVLKQVMNNVLRDTKYIKIKELKNTPLLIHGIYDKDVKISISKILSKKIKAPIIKVASGHFPQNEYPYLIAKVIESYANS